MKKNIDTNPLDETQNQPGGGESLSTAEIAAAARRQPSQDPTRLDPIRDDEDREDLEMNKGNGDPISGEGFAPLFDEGNLGDLRSRWSGVQTGFVDDPRRAVQQADELVAEVMKQLAEVFAKERSNLESGWSKGNDVSTEDLRVALRRYRSFFDRLLSV
jgi:hypothetical protein